MSNLFSEVESLTITKIKKYREYLFLFLYQTEMLGRRYFDEATFGQFVEQNEVESEFVPILNAWADGLLTDLQSIDEKIESVAIDWKLERIGKVELSLLRVYIFEIMKRDKLTPAILISDAVELSKKYGSAKCASFVNAILDSIYKKSHPTHG